MDTSRQERTSKENRSMYPKSFVSTTEGKLLELLQNKRPNDWIIVSDDEKKAEEFSVFLRDVIINPGCLYEFEGMFAINVLAHSLRSTLANIDAVSQLSVRALYPEDKIIPLDRLTFDHQARERYIRRIRFLSHLSVILIPSSRLRKKIRKKIEDHYFRLHHLFEE